MHYIKFLDQLLESGRVVIETADLACEASIKESKIMLAEFEQLWRQQLAFEAPPFDSEVTSWAGRSLYRACQLLMNRQLVGESAPDGFPEPGFREINAGTHYNVDILFRFLPDLVSFARTTDQGDWLSERIGAWCSQWPLSSVGIANPSTEFAVDIEGFAGSRCLMQLYVDRIIRKADLDRVNDDRVSQLIESSIGRYPQLAKRFRTELDQLKKTKTEEAESHS